MTRLVLKGTKDKPYVVQQNELEPHLAGSYFKHFRMKRLDLRGFALDNVDFLDGEVVDCDLTDATMRWMVSRRTKWTGSRLPKTLNTRFLISCHDVITELLTQGTSRTSGIIRDIQQASIDYINTSYHTSWPDTIRVLVDQGFSPKDVITASELAFGDIPGFMESWRYIIANPNTWQDKPLIAADRIYVNALGLGAKEADYLSVSMTDDRGELKQRIQAMMDARQPKGAPWCVQVYECDLRSWVEMFPASELTEEERSRWNFWEGKPDE